jgi:hypothetical protein
MEVLNTMTKIMDHLHTHGGIACTARWALIYRSLRGGRLRVILQRSWTRDGTEAEPLCDNAGLGKQLPNDNPV